MSVGGLDCAKVDPREVREDDEDELVVKGYVKVELLLRPGNLSIDQMLSLRLWKRCKVGLALRHGGRMKQWSLNA